MTTQEKIEQAEKEPLMSIKEVGYWCIAIIAILLFLSI